MKKADVVEIFSSIQGEGPHIGERHLFLRFCGCNLSCDYCDTEFERQKTAKVYFGKDYEEVANPFLSQELAEIVSRFDSKKHSFLSLTGGEPLIHSDFLLEFLPLVDFRIYLETNGIMTNELKKLTSLISVVSMDIKLPSSTGLKDFYAEHEDFIKIAQKANREVFLKAVVSNKITEAEIQKLKEFAQTADLIIQPISTDDESLKLNQDKLFEIVDKIPSARVIPQFHKFLNLM